MPTQIINFWLVPQRFRVVYVATVTFIYNSFLSYIKHNNEHLHSHHVTVYDQTELNFRKRADHAVSLLQPRYQVFTPIMLNEKDEALLNLLNGPDQITNDEITVCF